MYDECQRVRGRIHPYCPEESLTAADAEILRGFSAGKGKSAAAVYPALVVRVPGKFMPVLPLEIPEVALPEFRINPRLDPREYRLRGLDTALHGAAYQRSGVGVFPGAKSGESLGA